MMILFLILILGSCLYRLKIKKKNFFDDFLDKEQTNSIKGLFILFVFIRHALGYVNNSGYSFNLLGDKIVSHINSGWGQLIVVMFLFYSGYGVMESIKKKGKAYISSMPRKRFLNTLLNFDIAVLCFAVIDLLLNIEITPTQFGLSLIGWDSIGNSNWYIFVILVCYMTTFLAYKINGGERVSVILCMIAGILLYLSNKNPWWYNTILSYAAGLYFSTKKQVVIEFWKVHYWKSLVVLSALFVLLYTTPQDTYSIKYNFLSITFALLIVQLNMKIKVSNPILCWFGSQLFPLYIYQRIPMIILYKTDAQLVHEYPALFMGISLVITIIIAYFYKYWHIKKIIFPRIAD